MFERTLRTCCASRAIDPVVGGCVVCGAPYVQHRLYCMLFASFALSCARWNNECINLHFNPMHSHHAIATCILWGFAVAVSVSRAHGPAAHIRCASAFASPLCLFHAYFFGESISHISFNAQPCRCLLRWKRWVAFCRCIDVEWQTDNFYISSSGGNALFGCLPLGVLLVQLFSLLLFPQTFIWLPEYFIMLRMRLSVWDGAVHGLVFFTLVPDPLARMVAHARPELEIMPNPTLWVV